MTDRATQMAAAAKIRPGMVRDGWLVVGLVAAYPWPWVLLERGGAYGRASPRHVLEGQPSR